MPINNSTRRFLRISYFAMLSVLGGMVKFSLPSFSAVPYAFYCVVAIASGLILGKVDGMLSQIIYFVIGILGLPVFVNGGGYLYVLDPAFGYVLAFPFASYLAGYLKGRFRTLSVTKLFFAAFFSLALIYAVGMIYQFLSLAYFLSEGAYAALNSLIPLPYYFIVDALILYLLCLAYPKLLTVIGKKTTA